MIVRGRMIGKPGEVANFPMRRHGLVELTCVWLKQNMHHTRRIT